MDAIAIGKRIKDARNLCEIGSCELLGEIVSQKMRKAGILKKTAKNIQRQTVDNWERGDVIPPPEKTKALAEVFTEHLGPEYDEEWILFGPRRSAQLQKEKRYLSWISPDEGEILTLFRASDSAGQKNILDMARTIAKNHPAHMADIHPIRQKAASDDPANT